MEAKIINPFLSATLKIFESMFSISATPGEPYLMGRELGHRWEISGILGITGDHKGIVAIRLSRALANKMLDRSGIKTQSESEREELLYGMVGELVNIISGHATAEIPDELDISPPVVVYGENHGIAWPSGIPAIAIPFVTGTGPFEVSVAIKR